MSLFNNYQKPGPGVVKNSGYDANQFALYFQLLGRKYWSICVLSLTVTLYTIPYLLACYGLYRVFGNISFFASAGFQIRFLCALAPFGLYGPVLGAAFKIARDFVREEPVFLFSDFFNTFKNNLGKPIVLSLISYFFFSALTFALPAYYLTPGVGVYLFFPLCLLAGLALLFSQFYIYTMGVCFELSLKDICKNGLIFAFIAIFRNLLIFFVLLLLFVLCYILLFLAFSYPVMFGFLMILLACFLPAYFIYSVAFVTHPALQKYVVEPFYRANPEKTSAVLTKPVDKMEDTTERELPEYVYHNGRMVHRSVLESESLFDDAPKIGPDHQDQ